MIDAKYVPDDTMAHAKKGNNLILNQNYYISTYYKGQEEIPIYDRCKRCPRWHNNTRKKILI